MWRRGKTAARYSKRQLRNIGQAKEILADLRGRGLREEESLPIVIGVLRQTSALVVQELTLTITKEKGLYIYRPRSYSNDGGFDGRCYYRDALFKIQTKRYGKAINPGHVEDFAENIARHHKAKGGLLFHTGRTGDTSKAILRQAGNIVLISGRRLADFVLNPEASQGVRTELDRSLEGDSNPPPAAPPGYDAVAFQSALVGSSTPR